MRWQWTIDDGARSAHEVVVQAEPEVSIEVLADALALRTYSLWTQADDDASAADAAPLSGLVLPLQRLPVRSGGFALRFRSGPLAGQIVALARSDTRIGRGPDNDVVIPDPAVSRAQLVMTVEADEVRVAPVENARPVWLNGRPLGPAGELVTHDDLIEVGSSVLSIGVLDLPAADVGRDGAGHLAFNRPSRVRPRRPEHHVTLGGDQPEPPTSAPLPWAMAAVPLLLGGLIAYVAHAPAMLMMSVASPVMVVASYRAQRTAAAKRSDSALATWRRNTATAAQRLAAITDQERAQAWQPAPDPATVREICLARAGRLWERRLGDPDALWLRLGVAELPVPVKIENQASQGEPVEPYMSPVPVGVDLATSGVVGLAGPAGTVQALGRWVVLQLAALRSPRDLGIVLLCEQSAETVWRWVRWLPHLRTDVDNAPLVQVGNTDSSRAARVTELTREIDARKQVRAEHRDAGFDRDIVVLLDGARSMRTLSGMTSILRDGPAVGVYAVCLDQEQARLPEEAGAELLVDAADHALAQLLQSAQPTLPRMLVDAVTAEVAEQCARSLSPVLHVGGDGDVSELPVSVRLVELLGVDLDEPRLLAEGWRTAGATTAAVVGAGLDGPFALDLKLDGPHGLVAGTTGAGKSEFLQTLVVSLALGNRPDALNFVLVDYKGASAFADCERLPHTVGMVTNLDNRETERALASLDAELERRERLLREIGAKDVDDAWARDPVVAAGRGLGRLVLVVDEFAELVRELPEFVSGLVRIARVGRSLGVHLILATQRPAGVVSAEMQANVGLRVALRMADKENSVEVLGSAEAAAITASTPGRGFVRRGAFAAPVGFQTARVAGRRPGQHALTSPAPKVRPVGWAQLGEPLVFPSASTGSNDPNATDLHALVNLVQGATEHLGIVPNSSPWLPALPATLTVDELGTRAGPSSRSEGVLLGLLDVPARQAQPALRYRLGVDGHLLIAGSSRSGRSTMLRTLLGGLARTYSPDELHLYCIDFGASALLPARDLPHCGAVITGTEPDRIVRLLDRLTSELSRRQQILATHGFGDIDELRAHSTDDALPHIAVLLDRWEGFLSAYPLERLQELRDKVVKILREGPAAGVSVVLTGDRALITDRIAAFIETRYTLRLADRDDFRLVGIRPAGLPEHIPPGRAYFGEPTNEVQFAVLGADTSGQGQTAALREIVRAVVADHAGQANRTPALRVDVLPSAITLSQAAQLPVHNDVDPAGPWLLAGVGGDELSQYRVDFASGSGFLIAGQRQSGRSTALAGAAATLHAQHVPILVVAPKPSAAADAARRLGASLVTTLDATGAATIATWVAARERCAVLVDDADAVHGTDVDDTLVELARTRAPDSFVLVVAGPVDDLGAMLRGVAVEAKRDKQGVLLSPNSSLDGTALGTGIPRHLLGRNPPGRALLLFQGAWVPVQIPVPDPGPAP